MECNKTKHALDLDIVPKYINSFKVSHKDCKEKGVSCAIQRAAELISLTHILLNTYFEDESANLIFKRMTDAIFEERKSQYEN